MTNPDLEAQMSHRSQIGMLIQIESDVEEEEGHDENEDKDGILEYEEWHDIQDKVKLYKNEDVAYIVQLMRIAATRNKMFTT